MKKLSKKEIKEFVKGITFSNDKGLVLQEVIIFINNNELNKIVRYVGDKAIKYDKATRITYFIEHYLDKQSNLKDTVDIIYNYVNDMIEEYEEETKELEFYKKIDGRN